MKNIHNVYIKNCYKDKALILIILIELILLILIELNSMFLIYYFVIYFLYRICLIDIKTKLIDIKLLIALIVELDTIKLEADKP